MTSGRTLRLLQRAVARVHRAPGLRRRGGIPVEREPSDLALICRGTLDVETSPAVTTFRLRIPRGVSA